MTITEMNNMPLTMQEEILKRINYHYIPKHEEEKIKSVLTYTQPKMITEEKLMDLLKTCKQVQQEIKDSMKQTSVEDSPEPEQEVCSDCEQDPCECSEDPISSLRFFEDELKEFADFLGLHAKITYTTKGN